MGKVFYMKKGKVHTAPVGGLLLSSIAEGSIVKLNENGSPVEFYVAKHDYESALNGAGRTLLVRKDCYDTRAWESDNVNAYASSDIDTWLNGTYKALLDENVQDAISTTQFYYTKGNGTTTVSTLARSVFLLSCTELGESSTKANTEGTALDIASTLKIAYLSGSATSQWTRSPNVSGSTTYAVYLGNTGSVGTSMTNTSYGSRPAFTIPSTAVFDIDTLILKGVN